MREGAIADLVMFDPATVSDRATYEDPHQLSVGIEHVLVGGVEIFANGQRGGRAGAGVARAGAAVQCLAAWAAKPLAELARWCAAVS